MSEHIYSLIGGSSYKQYIVLFCICFVQFNAGLNLLEPIFINNYQDFFCNVKSNLSEKVYYQHKTEFKSMDNTTGTLVIDSQRCNFQNIKNICSEIYMKPYPMTSTIRSQYQLYCEYHKLSSVAVLLLMVGIFFGSLFGGVFTDRFGRIPGCILSYSMMSIFATIAALSPWFLLYVVARVCVGFAISVSYVSNTGVLLEIVELKERTNFGFYWAIGYDLGYIVLIGLAYFIRNHFTLQIALCCFSYISLIFPLFYKESFRWLLANNQYEKAKEVLLHIAHFNKRSVTEEQIDKAIESFDEEVKINCVKSVNLKEILHYKVVLLNVVILWFLFFSCSFSYYTFVLGSSKISDQIFSATIISALSCITVRSIYTMLCRRFGRISLLLSLQIGITFLFIGSMIMKYFLGNKNIITAIILMLSVALSGTNFGFMWTYGGETFPTVIRGTSVSIGSACARVSGMIASQMEWVFEVSPNALPIVGALMAIIGSLCTFFILPETFKRPSLDFLYQAEKYFVEWRQPWRKSSLNVKETEMEKSA